MITEDYCSFELSKLLKEKGFNESSETLIGPEEIIYHLDENSISRQIHSTISNSEINIYSENVSCPTTQMAMKWFRKEKGIAIIPIPSSVLDNEEFLWDVEIIVAKTNKTYYQGWVYKQYEEAIEAAIKYCLINLI